MSVRTMFGLALCLVACDGGGGDSDAGGQDGGATDGGGRTTDIVFELRNGRDRSPVEGAAVAFDAPDGTRSEGTTDAMGQITFAANWALGAGAVTAGADGYSLLSQVGLTGETIVSLSEDGVMPLLISPNPAARVNIAGTVQGAMTDTHVFFVSSNLLGATQFTGMGPDFSIGVPAGEPMRLFAGEFSGGRAGPTEVDQVLHGGTFLDLPAASVDVSGVMLDLSAAATISSVDGTLDAPGAGTPLAGATLYGIVSSLESNLSESFGAMTHLAPSASEPGVLEFTMEWAEPPAGVTPVARYFLQDGALFSAVSLTGAPSGGALDITFPAPPEIVTPTFGVMHPIHDPFEVGRVEAGLITSISIVDLNADDRLVWQIVSVDGETTIQIPEPPSAVRRSDIFPSSGDFYARPYVCELDATREYCERLAVGGRAFDLVP